MNASLNPRSLSGLPVLAVEDEGIVAMLLEDLLTDLGCRIVGPAARIEEALDLLEHQPVGAAVLDINIAGRLVFPVADELLKRNIPFIFATGYGAAGLIEPHCHRTVLQKPYGLESLQRALEDCVFSR